MNLSTDEQIELVEISIEQAKEKIKAGKDLEKLTKNREFTKLVLEGFFKEEASRIVLLKADPAMQEPEMQDMMDKQIIAIGYLRQYFARIMQEAQVAERTLLADEATHEELLGENVNA